MKVALVITKLVGAGIVVLLSEVEIAAFSKLPVLGVIKEAGVIRTMIEKKS